MKCEASEQEYSTYLILVKYVPMQSKTLKMLKCRYSGISADKNGASGNFR